MQDQLHCENCGCEICEDNFIEEENVDNSYHDIENGNVYADKENIPSGHSYNFYEKYSVLYECPNCKNRKSDHIDKYMETIERS